MKKHNSFKVVLITIFVVALCTWIFPSAQFSTQLIEGERVQAGLFDVFSYPMVALYYFMNIFVFVIACGAFYGVAYRIPAYKKLLEKITAGFKGRENIFLVLMIVLIAALILVGMFAAGFLGKFFMRLGEWIVYKLPVISSVYSLLKQVFETFLSNKTQSFNKVVMLEYPRKGIWILGFVSSDTKGEVKQYFNGEEMLNIFIPTTPNPTSGFLIFVPKKDTVELNMTVEEGLKFVISCGIAEPDAEKLKKK